MNFDSMVNKITTSAILLVLIGEEFCSTSHHAWARVVQLLIPLLVLGYRIETVDKYRTFDISYPNFDQYRIFDTSYRTWVALHPLASPRFSSSY